MSIPNRQIGWSNESNLLWQISKGIDKLTTTTGASLSNIIAILNTKVGGSGTTNYVPKWTSTNALGDSLVFDNGTSVGIGTASPSASSILSLSSTTKGLLIPTMTGTQVETIVSPAQGLLAYSTDASGTTVNQQGLWQYNNGSWKNTALKDDTRKLIWKYQNTFEYFSDFAQGSDGWNANNSGTSSYANDANFQINSDSWFNGIACSTGTTAAGRAFISSSFPKTILPTESE